MRYEELLGGEKDFHDLNNEAARYVPEAARPWLAYS